MLEVSGELMPELSWCSRTANGSTVDVSACLIYSTGGRKSSHARPVYGEIVIDTVYGPIKEGYATDPVAVRLDLVDMDEEERKTSDARKLYAQGNADQLLHIWEATQVSR